MKKILLFFYCFALMANPLLFAEKESNASSSDQEKDTSSSDSSGSTLHTFATGVKQVAYDGPKELAKETVSEVPKKPPIVSVVEGVNRGTQKLLDNTIRGAYKVATLGTSELDSYEIQEPEKGSDEPTKIKISIPGT